MTTYNTNLASEFYVLSMLHRLGVDASLTLGNKKAVDILITNNDGTLTTIDVKGLVDAYDWPADNIHTFENNRHIYVLISFEGRIDDPLFTPSVWVVPANIISEFIKKYRTRTVISRSLIKSMGQRYLQAWSIILNPIN